jgi:peptidoglycan biosynthesis protein MviN/MurJ (putative lipid II flippase)
MENADRLDPQEEIWAWIDEERRVDKKVRTFAYRAWVTTVGALVVYGVFVLIELAIVIMGLVRNDGSTREVLFRIVDTLMPLVWVIGAVALIAAVLSTVGVFLRLRTASLTEIQQRLAALEAMLGKDG